MMRRLLLLFAHLLFVLGCASVPPAPPGPAVALGGADVATASTAAAAAAAAVTASSPPHPTLPQFLGLGQLATGLQSLGSKTRIRLGNRFPGLEAKPPLRSITDPANSSEQASPAVQAAAEVKAEQDKTDQKVKAIRFLTGAGCGKCFPKTEEGLLAALDDCIEEVRYETVLGLRKAAGNGCQNCRSNSCCTPKLIEKLQKIGFETDEQDCYVESSARVRRLARLVLRRCGTSAAPEQAVPVEGPSFQDEAPVEELPVLDSASESAVSKIKLESDPEIQLAGMISDYQTAEHTLWVDDQAMYRLPVVSPDKPASMPATLAPRPPRE